MNFIYFQLIISLFLINNLPIKIINAIKNGNAAEIVEYFNTNTEVSILDKQDIYGKKQSEFLLKDFFSKNIPFEFDIIHCVGKEDSYYYIGKLVTSTGNYRVSILTKKYNEKTLIFQFKIEKYQT